MKLYPIAYMSWEEVKNCYHGQAVISGLIANQIGINKMAAMCQRWLTTMAFPRVFYDRQRLPQGIDNSLRPFAVNGSPRDSIYTDTHNVNMSGQLSEYIDKFISLTRDLMGASDAALGSVRPDNTSAIIAVAKATAVPLELVRQEYYQFTEDYVRILIDQMRAFYGLRTVAARQVSIDPMTGEKSEAQVNARLDFGILEEYELQLNIDIGTAAYWDEVTAITSLSNLFAQQIIDPLTFVKSLPSSAVPNKAEIEEKLQQRQEAQAQQMAQMQQMQEAQAQQMAQMQTPVDETEAMG